MNHAHEVLSVGGLERFYGASFAIEMRVYVVSP